MALRRLCGLLILVMLAGPKSLRAELIEIPLTELLGNYGEFSDAREVSFSLPQPPSTIHDAWFRISGTTTLGEALCEMGGEMMPWDWSMEFTVSMDADDGLWIADVEPTESGPFASTLEFRSIPPTGPTWSFLFDGVGDLTFYGVPSPLVGLCFEHTPPSGVVEEAVLIVDAEFPVPVANSTWGRIKALYH